MSEPLFRPGRVFVAMAPSKPEIRATYERIADSFATTRVAAWLEVSAFVESLPHGSRVLDVGSGNGRHAKVLAVLGHDAVAADFSRRLLAIGRRVTRPLAHAERIAWIEAEATNLPFQGESFDAGICVAVLHHLPTDQDRLAALAEIRRVLRPRGRVLVSVWARDQPRFETVSEAAATEGGDVDVPWTMPDGQKVSRYYHLFKKGELERLIIECGLHGEKFFRSAENWFALAIRDG